MLPYLLLAAMSVACSVLGFMLVLAHVFETSEPSVWLGAKKPGGWWRGILGFNMFLFGFFGMWYFLYLRWCAQTAGCTS